MTDSAEVERAPFQKPAAETAESAAVCRCGAKAHPTYPQRCARGHGLPRNGLTLKHGAYASRQLLAIEHAPQLASAESFLSGVITDRGGHSEVTTVERAYAAKLAELELEWNLLALDVRRHGILTPSGRPRGAYVLLLQTLDRWDRLAQRLGMGRRAKAVPTLDELLSGLETETDIGDRERENNNDESQRGTEHDETL